MFLENSIRWLMEVTGFSTTKATQHFSMNLSLLFSVIYCIAEFDEDEFNIDEEEIERECERLFPPIPPPKTSNGSDDDSLENLINMLGLTAQLEKCTRVQDSLTDTCKLLPLIYSNV